MEQFKSTIEITNFTQSGSIIQKAPSNIALIKYWGKKDVQIPMNPSLSFTLNNCYTETELKFKPKTGKGFLVNVYLDGVLNEHFVPRIYTFFERISDYVPFLESFEFEVHTRNTFPHSSGIASSASGLAALSLCLLELEKLLGAEFKEDNFLRKASFLARLGSGSACRSIYSGITVWGKSEFVEGSSDQYAIPYPYEIHPIFDQFQDTVLLIDEGQKRVSSSVGHQLMENHPYAAQRFVSANENLGKLIVALKNGDLQTFGTIVEHEALSLHAMMLTSYPAYILMKPNTLSVIEEVWKFRKTTGKDLYFTLDAGANVHLLYPHNEKQECLSFIDKLVKDKGLLKEYIRDFL